MATRYKWLTPDFVIWKQSSEFFILFWHLIIRAYHILSGNAVELTHEELEDFLSGNNTRQPNGLWMCNICGKSSSNRIDINRHVEAQHVKLPPLHCEICDKYYKTRDSFRRHETREHRVRVDVWTQDFAVARNTICRIKYECPFRWSNAAFTWWIRQLLSDNSHQRSRLQSMAMWYVWKAGN